jgi:hypothetical protein
VVFGPPLRGVVPRGVPDVEPGVDRAELLFDARGLGRGALARLGAAASKNSLSKS